MPDGGILTCITVQFVSRYVLANPPVHSQRDAFLKASLLFTATRYLHDSECYWCYRLVADPLNRNPRFWIFTRSENMYHGQVVFWVQIKTPSMYLSNYVFSGITIC